MIAMIMPRIYNIDLSNGTARNIPRVIMKFLECPYINKPEVGIININSKIPPLPGYVFPQDGYYACYDNINIPSEDILADALSRNMNLFSGIAAIDSNDTIRVGIHPCPAADGMKMSDAMISFFAYSDEISDQAIKEIIDYIIEKK